MFAAAAAGTAAAGSRSMLQPESTPGAGSGDAPPRRRRDSGTHASGGSVHGSGSVRSGASASLAQVSSVKASAVLDDMGLDWSMHTPTGQQGQLARTERGVKFFHREAAQEGARAGTPRQRRVSRAQTGKQLVPVLHPDRPFYRAWTNVLLVLLIWTATVTPFQVAFLEEDSLQMNGFWFISERVCDCLFGVDFLINFNTAVWADEATHGALELSRGVIARRYIFSGRAQVDLLCTVPWDLVAQMAAGANAGDGAGNGAGHAHRAKAARLLRLLTLMRVKRVLDAPDRLMQALRDSTGISHATTTLASLLLACFLLSHWLACALHLTAITQLSSCTWVQTYFNRLNGDVFADPCEPLVPMPSTGSIYIAALYWSVMTVTTVGYGDVAPYTDAERCMEIAGMLIGAVGYAVVIGAACGVVSQMSERSRALESALDTAGRLGGSQASNSSEPLPAETLARVRGYLRYVHARGAAWAEGDAVALSARLSPALRAEVALARRGETLRGAHVFLGANTAALAELSSALALVTLPPGEVLVREGERCDRLSLLRHGLVLTVQSSPARMRHITAGSSAMTPEHHTNLLDRLRRRAPDVAPPPLTRVPVFGVETLWRNPKAAHAALTLTYTELNVITRDRLVSILDRHVSLKVSARVHALSCLLVETIRQLGVAHTQIKRQAMTARFKRHVSSHLHRISTPQPPRPVRTRPASPGAAAPAAAEPVSLSRLAPPHQLGAPLPPLPGATEAPHPALVAAAAAFSGSPRRGPADGGLTTEQLREGWRIVTASPQPQLNLTLLLDAVQSGDPELWPGLIQSVRVVQRYCRGWLMRKRLAAIHVYTQSSLARGSQPNPEAAMAVVSAPNIAAAAEADDTVSAEDVALVEAVSLALTPQLRAIAISVESLINDVQALRNERS